MKTLRKIGLNLIVAITLVSMGGGVLFSGVASATTASQSTAIGIQGEIPSAPPTRGATIAVPSNGASFTSLPVNVSGTCPTGLLIKVFSNNVFMGSTICANGSYSVQINLFPGQNVLTAIDYDALNQAGPTSNSVTVTYSNAHYAQYGSQLTLSSNFAELGAAPGSLLTWPIIINGGTGPYAVSVDWGDGTASVLMSEAHEGVFNITHTYQVSGVYKVIVKATDNNGETAILQIVGQATGAILQNTSNNKNTNPTSSTQVKVEIWPNLITLPLILLAFWGGKRYHEEDLKQKQKKYEAAKAKTLDTKP